MSGDNNGYPLLPPPNAVFNPEYFPESVIALRVELEYHPDLQLRLIAQSDKDVYIQISEIAAHCGVILDGAYTREDLINLCDLLVKKLQKMRTILVN